MANQSNKTYWQRIAKKYDFIVGEKGDIRHKLIVNPIVFTLLGNLKGKIVLDAGCGNGYVSRKMAKYAKKVVGVDFTEPLINIAKSKVNPHNLRFVVGNLEKLQFQDQMFDVILCTMVIMDVEKLEVVIGELAKVLRIDGTLVVSTLHPCFENPPRTYSTVDGRVIQRYFDTGLVIDKNQIVDQGEYYQHYHYTISDYLNAFAKSNLCLKQTVEPNDGGQTPTFIIFRLQK